MNKQFRISPKELDAWAKEIEGLPKAEPEKLNKRHAILRLLPSIEDMKKNKGYSLAGIAKYFTEVKKLPITVSALKSILSHADGGASGSKKRRKRKAQEQRSSAAASPAQAAGTEGKLPGEVSSKKGGALAEPPKAETESQGEIRSKKKGDSSAEPPQSAAVPESKQEAKPDAKPSLGERGFAANIARPDSAGESRKEEKPEPKGSFVIWPDTKDI